MFGLVFQIKVKLPPRQQQPGAKVWRLISSGGPRGRTGGGGGGIYRANILFTLAMEPQNSYPSV